MRFFCRCSALAIALIGVFGANAASDEFPVTVDNCGRRMTFEAAPARAVVHDLNMAEIMFALHLQDQMVGLTGITGWYTPTPEFRRAMGDLPELASKYPTMETLLAVDPDFFFAGWHYGMKPGGEVSPETLGAFGIPVYVLSESCIHVDQTRPPVSLDTLYTDVRNIGRIFGRTDLAQDLIADWKMRIDRIQKKVEGRAKPRVFLYDSGEEAPFTAGKHAMFTALIDAAGGENIMADMRGSWARVGWEDVVARNPEIIVLLDYQNSGGWRTLADFLKSYPPMAATDAVQNSRFLPLTYSEITPGPANIGAVEALTRFLHPDAF